MNRYYDDAKFPHCFDITTLSEPLLRLAFERMGFTRIIEITAARDTCRPLGGRASRPARYPRGPHHPCSTNHRAE